MDETSCTAVVVMRTWPDGATARSRIIFQQLSDPGERVVVTDSFACPLRITAHVVVPDSVDAAVAAVRSILTGEPVVGAREVAHEEATSASP